MISWDRWFLGLAEYFSTRSKDPSTQCGAVIVDPKTKLVVGSGYNGFARGVEDTLERYNNRSVKYEMVLHAEVNAVLNSTGDLGGGTIYVHPFPPCSRCASVIIQAGIKRVVSLPPNDELANRWEDSLQLTATMFREANVQFHLLEPDE